MAIITNSQKGGLVYKQNIEPSNPNNGDVWFWIDRQTHYVYDNGEWHLIFDYPIVLGPHTYNVNFSGCECEALVRIVPFVKFTGCETEILVRIT